MTKKERIALRDENARLHAECQGPFPNAFTSFSAGFDLASIELEAKDRMLKRCLEFISGTPYEGSAELCREIKQTLE